ncbi:Tubulin polyglutamylase complex subunit 2 [Clonorchis sinensis]|uniref:Tubulin polyglutamylase complex subunit 2 n=1 Tax=Clonorchis sinensis TaxID=79923 RepID=A0A8T1MH84_CLOSI|nr:Tubulin polyglutamylase complex subunit 2 [Clonorchis sinensis]
MVINFLHDLKSYLETKVAVCDIVVETPKAVDEGALIEWERTNDCQLPDELRNFYLTTNGVSLIWHSKHSDVKVLIGRIQINGISALKQASFTFTSDVDVAQEMDVDIFVGQLMRFSQESPKKKMFILEQCSSSCVVLVLNSRCSEIYYIDRDASFHRLCDTLSQYIRLAAVHLGIIGWQTCYTSSGPRPEFLQYAALYTPERLSLNARGARYWLENDAGFYPHPVLHSKKLRSIEVCSSERSAQAPRNTAHGTSTNRVRSVESAHAKRSADQSFPMRKSKV